MDYSCRLPPFVKAAYIIPNALLFRNMAYGFFRNGFSRNEKLRQHLVAANFRHAKQDAGAIPHRRF
jgi:hypothetical protein